MIEDPWNRCLVVWGASGREAITSKQCGLTSESNEGFTATDRTLGTLKEKNGCFKIKCDQVAGASLAAEMEQLVG